MFGLCRGGICLAILGYWTTGRELPELVHSPATLASLGDKHSGATHYSCHRWMACEELDSLRRGRGRFVYREDIFRTA